MVCTLIHPVSLPIIVTSCRSVSEENGFVRVVYSLLGTAVMSVVVIYMFCISLVPHTAVDRGVQAQLPPIIRRWHADTNSMHLVNSYGLFRRFVPMHGPLLLTKICNGLLYRCVLLQKDGSPMSELNNLLRIDSFSFLTLIALLNTAEFCNNCGLILVA